jgi:two-component system, chemotaxis family, CheB/CheR fusion protein
MLNLYSSSGAASDLVPAVDEPARQEGRDPSDEVVRLAIEGLVDHALVLLDPHGVVTFWNSGAEQLFGWRREQAVRVHVSSLLGAGGPGAGIGMTDLSKAKRQGSVTAARRLNCQDGSTRDVRTTILALRNTTRVLGYGLAA